MGGGCPKDRGSCHFENHTPILNSFPLGRGKDGATSPCHSKNQTPILNSFPDPRVDSRFNLSGCPRMTYEDDIQGKDRTIGLCHFGFVASPSTLPRGKGLGDRGVGLNTLTPFSFKLLTFNSK
ncbi:MAG: hypothetical protein LBQ59_01845 [Candidatus Peribacteria bacterium]|nr:hypothetical protein [Candidatus Peribacteria bacterium]